MRSADDVQATRQLPFVCRDVLPFDEDALVAVGVATGLFSPAEADALLRDTLQALAGGALDAASNLVRVIDGDGGPRGWTYIARDAATDGVWELMWIGVARAAESTGVGSALLTDAECAARARGARMLLIATSSGAGTARARVFYERRGYIRVGCVPDYYSEGDDKILYHRSLPAAEGVL